MRQRLLVAIAERDHYLAALRSHGIDPGPAPQPVARAEAEPTAAPPGGQAATPPEADTGEPQPGAAEPRN